MKKSTKPAKTKTRGRPCSGLTKPAMQHHLNSSASAVAYSRAGLAGLVALGLLGGAGGPLVYAQDTQEETETEAEDQLETEEIIVSGTRLKNKAFAGVAPVQVLNPDRANLIGDFTATSIIRSSSLATGSFQINQQLGATSPGGSTSNGGAGSNGLSLRGLGTQRTLIVLDGRRLSPAGVQGRVGSVDLNVLPASALSTVEIIKDGSSSVFGADAIAGVVNGVTKKNYDGGSINAFGNLPLDSGGEQFFFSGNYGKTFEKGWISIAGEYSEDKRLRNSERDFLECSEEYLFVPGTNERADITDPDGSFKCRNHNPNGAFFSADWFGGTFQPDPDGALVGAPGDEFTRPSLPDWVRVGNFWLDDSDAERESYGLRNETSEAYEQADAISPLRRFGLFVNGAYEINDDIELYGSFLYNRRESEFSSWAFLFQGMSGDNPNNTVSAGLQEASGGGSSGAIQYQVVRPYNPSQTIDYFTGTMGVKGNITSGALDGWSWDAFATYGKSVGKYTSTFLYEDRLNAISLGSTSCDVSYLNSAVSPESVCDGINIPVLSTRFLVDQDWTEQEKAFLIGEETGKTVYEQFVVEGSIGGALFDLPAGAVEAVFGASYRRDEINDDPGENAIAGNYHLFSTAGITAGSEKVKEVFGELGIPLLADTPFAHDLSAVVSARHTDYTISGSKTTYKAGLNWAITPSFAVRGSIGTSFRGPNLYELFLADQVSFEFISDPCREYANSSDTATVANCTALGIPDDFIPLSSDAQVASGGAILPDGTSQITPETANSFSVGFIFTPEGTGLSVAVEYFDIEVKDQIDTLGAQAIVNQCYSDDDFDNSAFCSLLQRNGANPTDGTQPFLITSVNERFINIDSQRNRGIDFLVSFNRQFGDYNVGVDAQGTFQLEDEVIRVIGGVEDIEERRGLPNEPDFSGTLDFYLTKGDWELYYRLNAIGSSGLTELYGGDTFTFFNGHNGQERQEVLETGFYTYHTVSVSHHFGDGLRATIGVNNLLDRDPPTVSSDWRFDGWRTGVAAQNSWDLRGRRIFFNVRKDF